LNDVLKASTNQRHIFEVCHVGPQPERNTHNKYDKLSKYSKESKPKQSEISEISKISKVKTYTRIFVAMSASTSSSVDYIFQLMLLTITYFAYISYFDYVSLILIILVFRFLDQCRTVFPFKKSKGCYIMATEKVHSVIHSPNDVARFCHYLNFCCEAPQKGIKCG
jgi:hypothetical protein